MRLYPAAHCRTPIVAYSLNIQPEQHFLNWQQDTFGNYQAHFYSSERVTDLVVKVD
ncbi:MAG: transglutaminase N-terminal domain-containing protein [Pirellulaceae bacterium]